MEEETIFLKKNTIIVCETLLWLLARRFHSINRSDIAIKRLPMHSSHTVPSNDSDDAFFSTFGVFGTVIHLSSSVDPRRSDLYEAHELTELHPIVSKPI